MAYLDPTEYVMYGLTAETTDDWVEMASVLIDAHCRRQCLLVTQYVERMRLTAGSQAVRLSYLPLTPLGTATSPLVGVQVRYGRPRRGELQDTMLAQVAWAFSARSHKSGPEHCNWGLDVSHEPAGAELQRG